MWEEFYVISMLEKRGGKEGRRVKVSERASKRARERGKNNNIDSKQITNYTTIIHSKSLVSHSEPYPSAM